MNEQRKRSFIDFLVQLIFIILFVILLIWLFPTKDWMKENYFNGNGGYVEEKESTIEDQTFVDNINNMLEGAKSYFGYDVNLPGEDETVEVTLGELVEKHVIIMPRDKKGNKCDESSKATITKTLNGYAIKVELTCGKTTDYIIRNVGCNPFCENNCNTQKCTLEYEYSKKINGYWTNWSNWSSWSTTKRVSSETLKVEKKTVNSKICPNGYTLNSDKSACVKVSTSEIIVDAEVTKTCPVGYEFNSDKTACIKNNVKTITKDAEVVYTCKQGYTLTKDNKCVKNGSEGTKTVDAKATYSCKDGYVDNGTSCVKTTSVAAEKHTNYTCNSGYSYIGSGTCQRTITKIGTTTGDASCSITFERVGGKVVQKETCTYKKSATKNVYYTCKAGTLSGTDCIFTETQNRDVKYSCAEGTLNGDKCVIKVNPEVIASEKSYKCSEGTLKDNKCIITTENEEKTDVNITYSCKEGILKDNKCVITKESPESTKYTLKEVTYYRYSTRKYVKESISYKWSASKTDKKLLDAGYKLTGKTRKNCSK